MSDEFNLKLSIFPVKEKKNEKGPDHTGAIEIPQSEVSAFLSHISQAEPEEDWQGNPIIKLSVSTWVNEMKDGRKYLKGQVKKPYVAPVDATPASNDLPF